MREGDGGLLGRHLRPLLDGRDATVEAMVEMIQDRVADYRTFSTPEDEAEWAAGVGSLLDLFLSLAAEDRWLTPTEAHGIRSIGARRAEQGFSQEALRESVRAAVHVARTRIMEEYEPASHDDRAAMHRVLELLHRFSCTVEDLLQDGHGRHLDRLRARSGRRSEHLLAEVLDGVLVDHEVFQERATAVGCDPAVSRALFVTSTEAGASLQADAGLPGMHIAPRVAPAEHAVVVVAVPLPDAIDTVLMKLAYVAGQTRSTVLFLGLHSHPVDAHLGYVGSLPVLPYLSRIAEGRSVLDAADVLLYRLAAALPEPVQRSLHHEVFGRIEARRSVSPTGHYEALATFIRNDFRVAAVVRDTGRDRKTVYGTRDELSSATGRTLNDARDQAILSFAYAVHRLVG